MRRALTALAAVAACAAAVPAAGCGAGDVDPADVAEAAEVTRAAQTARVRWHVRTRGFGLPRSVSVEGAGTTALDAARMDLRLDVGPVLALAGAERTSGSADVVVRGKDLYVRPPRVDGLALPGGRRWIGLDLAETVAATGTDVAGLAEILTIDPGAQIEVLRSAEGVEEVGRARVGGTATTHLRGRLSLSDYAAGLPAGRRARAERAIEQFTAETGGDEAQPFEVWIDDRDRVRRMTQTARVPGQPGVPRGEVTIAMELSDFGARLDAQAPPRRDTFDATGALRDALAAAG